MKTTIYKSIICLMTFFCILFVYDSQAQFTKYFGASTNETFIKVVQSGNNYYCLGRRLDPTDNLQKATVTFINSLGQFQWTEVLPIASEWTDAVVTPSGLLTVGYTLPFNSSTKSLMGTFNAGGAVGAKSYDVTGRDFFNRIIKSPIASNFQYYIVGGQHDPSNPSVTWDDVVLLNVNAAGTIGWKRKFNSIADDEFFRDLEVLPNGELVICGSMDNNGVILKLDQNGILLNAGTPENIIFSYTDISRINNVGYYAVGEASPTFIPYLIRYDNDFLPQWHVSFTGLTDINQVWHDPATGRVFVTGKAFIGGQTRTILIRLFEAIKGSPAIEWVRYLDKGETAFVDGSYWFLSPNQIAFTDGRIPAAGGYGGYDAFLHINDKELTSCMTKSIVLRLQPRSHIYNSPDITSTIFDIPRGVDVLSTTIEWKSQDACQIPCNANFNFQNLSTCGNIQFTNQSAGAAPMTYTWNFGDPASGNSNTSTSTNPTHQFSICGNYQVCLIITASDGCKDTICKAITYTDNIKPVITCPADITVSCNTSTLPSATGTASATDNCMSAGAIGINYSDVSAIKPPCSQIITRTWQATDVCKNTSSCIQIINVVDTTKPTIYCPQDRTVQCNLNNPPSLGLATATDNCTPTANIVLNHTDVLSGTAPCNLTITRTWTAEDLCKNKATCIQIIKMVDTIPPTISCPRFPTVNTNPGLCYFTGSYPSAVATDSCDSNPTIVCSLITPTSSILITPTTQYPKGVHTITCYAVDVCGNQSKNCEFKLTVVDNEKPKIECPLSISVIGTFDSMGTCKAIVKNIRPIVTDNCPMLSVVYTLSGATMTHGISDASGSTFMAGTTTVHYTATDMAGNTDTCSFTIMVVCEDNWKCLCKEGNAGSQNLVTNGNFNNGNTGFTNSFTYFNPGNNTLIGGYSVVTNNNVLQANNQWACSDHTTGTGQFLIIDGASNTGNVAWSHQVAGTDSGSFNLCFYVNNLVIPGKDYDDPIIGVFINNQQVIANTVIPENPNAWIYFNATWTGTLPATIEIRTMTPLSVGNDFAIDDISFKNCNKFDCIEDFEDETLGTQGHWLDTNGTVSVVNTIPQTPQTQVLCGLDGSGPSWMYNKTEYNGDWIQKYGNNCFCFDIRYDNGNSANPSTGTSTLSIYSGQSLTSGLRATFVVNPPGIGNSWSRICIPIGLANGNLLPSNQYGSWVGAGSGFTAADWNTLIQSVSGIAFVLDFAGGSNPSEKVYVDNICIEKCPPDTCTCDPTDFVSMQYFPVPGVQGKPTNCGDTLTATCNGDSSWILNGQFQCSDSNCTNTSFTWNLTKPLGSASGLVNYNNPNFSVNIPASEFSQAGFYNLSLTSICGKDTCHCSFVICVTCCIEEFEDETLGTQGYWLDTNGTVSVVNTIPQTPQTQVLCGLDGSGPSWMYNKTEYNGDWIQKYGNNCFCFDIRYDNGNSANPITGTSTLNIYSGTTLTAIPGLRATFVLNTNNAIGNAWKRVCVPIALSNNGVLPSNQYGQWTSTSASDFDNLISNVNGIAFVLDFAGGDHPSEKLYIDNICIEKCPKDTCKCKEDTITLIHGNTTYPLICNIKGAPDEALLHLPCPATSITLNGNFGCQTANGDTCAANISWVLTTPINTVVQGIGNPNISFDPAITNAPGWYTLEVHTLCYPKDSCFCKVRWFQEPCDTCACSEESSPTPNLVVNGNFSFGDHYFASGLISNQNCGSGSYWVDQNFTDKCNQWPTLTDHTQDAAANFLIIDGNPTNAVNIWSQSVNVLQSTTYCFSFWTASVYDTTNQNITLNVIIDDGNGVSTFPVNVAQNTGTPGWVQHQFNWTCPNSGNYTVSINQTVGHAFTDFGIDDICFSKVSVGQQPSDTCCDESKNIIANGSFLNQPAGNLTLNSLPWFAANLSPQIGTGDSCTTPNTAQMWGNSAVGEVMGQTIPGLFKNGWKYRIEFCAKFININNLPANLRHGWFNLEAEAGAYTGNGALIGQSPVLTQHDVWVNVCLPDWTPTTDYNSLFINFLNSSTTNHGDSVSWGRIDDICIQVVDSSCCADSTTFANLVNQGFTINKTNCKVVVTAPQFDSCYSFSTPPILDGAIVPQVVTDVNGMWMYNFTQSGVHQICVTVTDNCNSKQMCTRFEVICDTCRCGSFSNLSARLTGGAQNQSLQCGKTYPLTCPTLFQLSGEFNCQGNDCDSITRIDWNLNGSPAGGISMLAGSGFTLPLTASNFSSPGLYTLTLIGYCDGKPCPPCIIYFEVTGCDTCCTDSIAFNNTVANFQTNATLGNCTIFVNGSGLDSCMQVTYDWGDGMTSSPVGNGVSLSHTYTGGTNTYTLCYTIAELDKNGKVCWSKKVCERVYIICENTSDSCECAGADHLSFGGHDFVLPTTCNSDKVIEIPCGANGQPFYFHGNVHCKDDSCLRNEFNWVIKDTSTITVSNGSGFINMMNATTGHFDINNLQASSFTPGITYTLTVTWYCGDKKCTCDIKFRVKDCKCDCGKFDNVVLKPSPGSKSTKLSCGDKAPTVPCPTPGKPFNISGQFHCVGDDCPSNTTIDWELVDPLGNQVATGTISSTATWSLDLFSHHFGKLGTYTILLTGHCGSKLCTCKLQFTFKEACPCDDCICGKYSDLFITSNSGPSTPVACGDTASISCPPNGRDVLLSGSMQCQGDSCKKSTTLDWILLNPQGLPVANGNNVLVNPGFTVFISPLVLTSTGVYTLQLIGHCGTQRCTCEIKLRIERPCPDKCECDKFSIFSAISRGPILPKACGDIIYVPDGLKLFFSAAFNCQGVCPPYPPIVTWSLTGPNGFAAQGGNTSATPNINIGIDETTFTLPGVYTLTMTGHCGNKECKCTITFIKQNDCCKDQEIFEQTVLSAIQVSTDPTKCKATVSIGKLPVCDYIEKINWGDGTSSVGPFVTGDMPMHTYSTSGTYSISIIAVEEDPNMGMYCFVKLIKETVKLSCGVIGNLNQLEKSNTQSILRVFPNPTSSHITLELSEQAVKNTVLRILNSTGKILMEQSVDTNTKLQSIDATRLPQGMYFIQIISEGKAAVTQKFIKQ